MRTLGKRVHARREPRAILDRHLTNTHNIAVSVVFLSLSSPSILFFLKGKTKQKNNNNPLFMNLGCVTYVTRKFGYCFFVLFVCFGSFMI